jgi:ankyrin repeat protein
MQISAFHQDQGESIRQQTGEEKLITAIKNQEQQAALELIKQGASLTVKDEGGNTPLSLACEYLPAVALVIAKIPSVDVNTKDNTNSTPLMKASLIGYTDLVDILLQKGANIDEKNDSGYTALYYACAASHLDTAKFLIRKGATIKQHDFDSLVDDIRTYTPPSKNMTEVINTLKTAIKGGRRRRSRTKRGPRGHKTRKNPKQTHKKN